ncbi:MAG: GNAT family N-acetyltransferase [Verrucomicrobia bacterium]|nr:MAG: GNAT family N-acetyltransferase [Verrucomicrobiota bacterium]
MSPKLIKNNRQSGLDRRRTGVDFDLQPTLKGDLIELRPLGPQDFDALFSAASDPKIWKQHPESDRYQREVFQRFFDGALESKGAFAIIERKSGRIIGSSRYCNLDLANREVEVGWTFLEREFWGGIYNRELKQLMLEHAFRFVDRVVFVVGEQNFRSQKALAKIGASFLKKTQLPGDDGTIKTNLVFAITAKSYRSVVPAAQH